MPLASIHLVRLSASSSIQSFLQRLDSSGNKAIIIARCVRWIIKPEQLSVSQLLDVQWDLFLVLPDAQDSSKAGPFDQMQDSISAHWTVTVGIPSRVLQGFEQRNNRLLHPHAGDVPELTGSMSKPHIADSAQGLELSNELLSWSQGFKLGRDGAVSMLNLLAFKSVEGADESYRRYGKAFGESIGRRRGGDAKLVGKVVPNANTKHEDQEGWEEFALAHYPSIRHFVDMIASEDYQEVNHRDRLPSLKDTCILCTTELDPELSRSRGKL